MKVKASAMSATGSERWQRHLLRERLLLLDLDGGDASRIDLAIRRGRHTFHSTHMLLFLQATQVMRRGRLYVKLCERLPVLYGTWVENGMTA